MFWNHEQIVQNAIFSKVQKTLTFFEYVNKIGQAGTFFEIREHFSNL